MAYLIRVISIALTLGVGVLACSVVASCAPPRHVPADREIVGFAIDARGRRVPHGLGYVYYPDGRERVRCEFEMGLRTGTWQMYSPDGVVVASERWSSGVLIQELGPTRWTEYKWCGIRNVVRNVSCTFGVRGQPGSAFVQVQLVFTPVIGDEDPSPLFKKDYSVDVLSEILRRTADSVRRSQQCGVVLDPLVLNEFECDVVRGMNAGLPGPVYLEKVVVVTLEVCSKQKDG